MAHTHSSKYDTPPGSLLDTIAAQFWSDLPLEARKKYYEAEESETELEEPTEVVKAAFERKRKPEELEQRTGEQVKKSKSSAKHDSRNGKAVGVQRVEGSENAGELKMAHIVSSVTY